MSNAKHGVVCRPKFITREQVRANPTALFVFGDNMRRVGLGGQAKAMRGEPNAVGVPTKWAPGMAEKDFFTDRQADEGLVIETIRQEFRKLTNHVIVGGDVYIPADGLGTGLSQLPERAPAVLLLINALIDNVENLARAVIHE